jgi:SAM-dependent methyltransferase
MKISSDANVATLTDKPAARSGRIAAIRARAARRNNIDAGFLHAWASDIIGQRLHATNRRFESPALLFDGPFSDLILKQIGKLDISVSGKFQTVAFPTQPTQLLPLQPGSIDLAISVLDLHQVADLPAMLLQINLALKPDGLLLAVLPVSGSLEELRQVLLQAESQIHGGAAVRIDQFPQIRELGDLMQTTGYKLVVADTETTMISYSKFNNLVQDLRSTGASNPLRGKPLSKSVVHLAKDLYGQRYSTSQGKLEVTVKLGFLSGWKAHESQQRPLKPGSGKHSLQDFL